MAFPTHSTCLHNLFPIKTKCDHGIVLTLIFAGAFLPPFDLWLPPGSQSEALRRKHKHLYHDGPSPGVNSEEKEVLSAQ